MAEGGCLSPGAPSGCDGEHTPNIHMLMGEGEAKVNFIAGTEGEEEYEWEYEDGGLWVGTVGAVEVLEWGGEASTTTDALASVLNGSHPDKERGSEQTNQESDFQISESPEEESAGDGWWDLEMGSPDLEDEATGASQAEPPCPPPYGMSWSRHPSAAREQGARKKQKTTGDQWEEARQSARLRQMLSSGLSSEDEDEEQHGRGGESERWMPGLYEPP
jgi:hypothetical protein